ncbi:hypothetical protein GJR96_07855 [Haloferax sp. MBLA0076]|uniref:Uncharacterized protein n=1 Tax=Haloferax litoreum TaxID=2666140 RepID=A0A6A8GG78_9EURY|nr:MULTISPECIES: hypothetical protein [Haloferax]KAB1193361.1 hypothetical protein Hfx1148_07850 [Haloferax sp. CBA1148]MRX21869.1 hypothetical protein [Haloferax litoreum]
MSRSNGGGILFETFVNVVRALQDLDGKARNKDIVESEYTTRDERQVLNVLQELRRMGYVTDEKRGMYTYWIADEYDLTVFYTREKEYLDNLTTGEEWNEQKREYMLKKLRDKSPELE